MRFFIAVLLLSLMITPIALAEPEIKGNPAELVNYLKLQTESVQITADARLEVQAESAIVIISVITEKESLRKALEDNQRLRQEIIQKLNKSGISSNRISGTKFSSTPQYGYWGKKPKSYKVENVFKITVQEEKDLLYIADMVDNYSEVYYRQLIFEHKEKEELKLEALALAFKNLNKKIALYENELGLRLVPKNFKDGRVPQDVPIRELERTKADSLMYEVKSEGSKMAGQSGTAIFGELIFNASISVEYLVKKK